ncbi:MAG: nitrous oxide reductase accessory protein NosL [Nitrospirota bacterium]|nr:nitrous oxide reductase accessory protein NosL [Nitrospirota bacterium]
MKRVLAVFFQIAALFIFIVNVQAQVKEDIHLQKKCKYCGMDRGSFDFSRVLIEYDDGTSMAVCSIHCAAVDLANNIDKSPKWIKVGDLMTKELIDAEKAFWIIGGSKPGVMSKRGKWAFAKKEEAESFIKSNGGVLADFEAAMKAAYEDMYTDTKMIRDKRKAKKMQHNMQEHKH